MMRLTFLLDVDNTLLDNDAAKREIDRQLRELLGAPETARFWRLYEAVRRDTGVVSYPLTLATFAEDARAHHPPPPDGETARVAVPRQLADLLLDFPYDRFVFPHALETIARLRALGRVVILSDGDPTYQPLKIARSGLSAAVDGYVLVYPHKEEHLRELTAAFVADHYVLVDDKPAVIDKVRARLAAPLTTAFVRQGKYAAGAAPDWCGADIMLEEIGELLRFDAPRLLARAGRALVERDAALARARGVARDGEPSETKQPERPREEDRVEKPHYGLVGLAVMGANLALNIADHGFPIAVYNRTTAVTREFLAGEAHGKPIVGAATIEEFVAAIERPRRIIILVKAGAPVDAVIAELRPYLDAGDVIIDGGNSFFHDTMRRDKELTAAGFHFIGMGVSGGEEGARHGPSLMPGGPRDAYRLVEPVLTKIAAQVKDGPCVTYIGPDGAGHYVKMVHNGIEYGDMQLIAETYNIMKQALGLSAHAMSEIFARWNQGRLNSYLIEITAKVLAFTDQETGQPLVDLILDEAEQKGTGRWTTQNASELGIPIPTIDAAVWSRGISALKPLRVEAARVLRGPSTTPEFPRERLLSALEGALYAAKISSYAQGLALLRAASEHYGWDLNLAEIARIWKGGCIIRAALLDPIQRAFERDPALTNLLLDPGFAETVNGLNDDWRYAALAARQLGVPCPATSASLDYFDSYRAARLPANLIQGQRDFFGAHTYRRLDKPGTFHTEWDTQQAPAVGQAVVSAPSTGRGAVGEDETAERARKPPV